VSAVLLKACEHAKSQPAAAMACHRYETSAATAKRRQSIPSLLGAACLTPDRAFRLMTAALAASRSDCSAPVLAAAEECAALRSRPAALSASDRPCSGHDVRVESLAAPTQCQHRVPKEM
jgi:hypothetical protein